jgi:AraC family transcriptional regulator
MKPRIETLAEKKLVGNRTKMSFSDNRTFELWRSFMPRRKEIRNSLGTDLYSVEVYPPVFWENFSADMEFEKWAAIEVTDFDVPPDQMEVLTVPAGLYAVFVHRGPASTASETYEYIFRSWLPGSEFTLDNRPHFALMGEKYKQNGQDSEEEIWIPVKQ